MKALSTPKHGLSASQLSDIISLLKGMPQMDKLSYEQKEKLKNRAVEIIPPTSTRDMTLHPFNNFDISQHIGSFLGPKDAAAFAQINLNCHETAPFALMQSLRETKQFKHADLLEYRKAFHLKSYAELFSLFAKEFSLVKKCDLADAFEPIVELLSCVAKYCPSLEEINLANTLNMADGTSDAALIFLAKNCSKIKHIDLAGCSDLTDASVLKLTGACPDITYLNLSSCYLLTSQVFARLRWSI